MTRKDGVGIISKSAYMSALRVRTIHVHGAPLLCQLHVCHCHAERALGNQGVSSRLDMRQYDDDTNYTCLTCCYCIATMITA